jgi:hypothetical protein
MKKRINPAILPTLVCAWCHHLIRRGTPKISHGICRSCVAHCFSHLRLAHAKNKQ